MVARTAFATALLAAAAVASPAPRSNIMKRFTDGVDCTGDEVATSGQAGLFFAVDSDGHTMSCDDAINASASAGDACYVSNTDTSSLGDYAKCPQDPAPAKNPDGSDQTIAEGVINTYCNTAGGPAFPNIVGCFIFGYYEAQGDPVAEAEAGAAGVCNVIFSGACNWFMNIAPEIAAGMDRPCTDDPGSNACAFANPGK